MQLSRHLLVRFVLIAAMFAGILLSFKLWLTDRYYPHVPVWDDLPHVPKPFDSLIVAAMLFFLMASAVLVRERWPVWAFLGTLVAWCMWDQSRWQPWVYQYAFMMLAISSFPDDDADGTETALNICRLILVATYTWSGLQKINACFATDTYPWLMEPVVKALPASMKWIVPKEGWHAAWTEFAIGVSLLVWPLRLVAVPMVVAMHLLILFCLWGQDWWNTVVWPWNLAMIALNLILYVNTRDVKPWQIVLPRNSLRIFGLLFFADVKPAPLQPATTDVSKPSAVTETKPAPPPSPRVGQLAWDRGFLLGLVVLILFGVMPFFDWHGLWDSYLSAALYSGNTMHCRIIVTDDVLDRLPAKVRLKHTKINYVDINDWSFTELNVPTYPARRVFRKIALSLGSPEEVMLLVEERPDWDTPPNKRKVTRENLGKR